MSLLSHPVFKAEFTGTQWIEASAGSGKTWTVAGLVARAVVEKGLPLESILVTTFTEAAAAELKARVRDKLVRLAAALEDPARPVGDPFCETFAAGMDADARVDAQRAVAVALASADRLSATTIHGFCRTVIGEFGLAAALPEDARLERSTADLRRRSMLALLRERAAGCDALARALGSGLDGATPDALDAVLQHRDAVAILDEDAFRPEELAGAARDWEAAVAALRDAWLAHGASTVEAIHALYAAKKLPGNWQKRWVESAAGKMDGLLAARCAWSVDELEPKALARLSTGSIRDAVKAGGTPVRNPATDAVERLAALAAHRRRIAAGLRGIVREHGFAAIDAAKRRERVIDFDDLIRCVADGVSGPAGRELAARLKERWPVAFVDEAQDTDPLQWKIVDAVWGDGTLFVVGDPKQAIYAFRGADLNAYLAARDRGAVPHPLADNRRSSAGYVAAVNAIFHVSADCNRFLDDGVRYVPANPSESPPGAVIDAAGRPLPPLRVEVHAADAAPPVTARRADFLAERAADRIAALLRADGPARATREPKPGCPPEARRPLKAGDVAVLVHRREDGHRMAVALRARGIGAVQVGDGSVLQSGEAADLRRLFAAMDDPSDDALLRAAVATPLLSDGLEAVLRLRGAPDSEHARAGDDAEAAREAWRERFRRAEADWALRGALPALRRFFADTGVDRRLSAFADGERRLTNLAHLADLLHAVEPPLRGAGAARRWLLAHREDESDEMLPRLESDDDLVRIATIHGSKGLEYPVVFLPFVSSASWNAPAQPSWCDRDGRKIDLRLRRRDEDGGAPLSPDGGLRCFVARHEEQVRLAYVALTRAVHHCTLLWLPDGRAGKTGTALSPFAWLLHGSDRPIGADGKPEELPDEAEMRVRLRALAARAPGCIDIVEAGPLPGPVGTEDVSTGTVSTAGVGAAPEVSPVPPAPVVKARSFRGRVPPPRVRLSYSSVVARAPEAMPEDEDLAARDRDAVAASSADAPDEVAPPRADGTEPPRLLRGGGTAWGHCLHAILETADLAAPLRAEDCAPALERWGFAPRVHAAEVAAWLDEVLDAPVPAGRAVPGAPPFTLRQAARVRAPLRELEFDLRLRADPARLRAVLSAVGPVALDGSMRLEGLLRGFIDAVFIHGNRVWVIDWKSNRLGEGMADYAEAPLKAAMDAHGYRLQGLLYCVALERLLRARGGGPGLELGGIVYAFLRGAGAPGAPAGQGFWVEAFPPALREAACAALDGRPVPGATDTVDDRTEARA